MNQSAEVEGLKDGHAMRGGVGGGLRWSCSGDYGLLWIIITHCPTVKRIFSSVMGPDSASKNHLTPLGKWNEEAMNSLCQPGKMVGAWAGTVTVATGKEGLMRDAWQR